MKTIRILIAASDEMRDESLKFSELIANLNEVLEPRGIELERVKWNPETDGSIDEFKASLTDCEMCLALYWKNLSSNSGEELDTAYQELKDGHNPRKLYVFFKEPSEDIADALRDFKANFENKYGHFFCRFENADTMNLHFILQFEAYNNQMNSDLVKVTDGKVLVGDKEMVNLDNVPFAAMNKEYQRLQKELLALEEEIAGISVRYAANTKDKELLKQMSSLGSKREQLSEEFEKYQRHLYDIALTFAKQSGEHYSERMRKARELFEVGKVIEADQILNMEDMKREKNAELALRMQNLQNLETMIEEFCLKADTVMANTSLSIPDRFTVASDAYDDAVSIAKEINYDEVKLAKILFDYAFLLHEFNCISAAIGQYQEALKIRHRLAQQNPQAYEPDLAETLNNLANLYARTQSFKKSELMHLEVLEIYRRLVQENPQAYEPGVAMTLNNLATSYFNTQRFKESESMYLDALRIRRRLAQETPQAYEPDVAMTLNDLANLYYKTQRFKESESMYLDALRIRRRLAQENPQAYEPDVAQTLNNLANLYKDLQRLSESEKMYLDALDIYRRLVQQNPQPYEHNLAAIFNNLSLLYSDTQRFDESEKMYLEALDIYRRLAQENSQVYEPDVAMTLNNLATLYFDTQRFKESESMIWESLEIYRRLAHGNPQAYEPDVAMTLYNLGLLRHELCQYDEAKKYYEEALEICHSLAVSTPESYLRREALTLTKLGNLQEDLENIDEAKRYWREALKIFRELEEKNPGDYSDRIEFLEAWTKEE